MNKGTLHALGAYLLWGILPVYWKAIHNVPAAQILANRIVWSFALLAVIVGVRKEWRVIRDTAANRRRLLVFFVAACLLSVNWLTYIWAVNAGFIVEASLGYFINPLVSVVLGVVFLKERLRPWQWLPVGLATLGVIFLTFSYGSLPWIALVLALTFGLYGLAKKTAPLGSLHSLTLETSLMLLPSLVFLLVVTAQGEGALGQAGFSQNLLLVMTGVVTALPLLLFGSAARQIPLTTIGILQYIAPTCQFLLGVFMYHEPFAAHNLFGFGLIWVALGIFWVESYLAQARRLKLLSAQGSISATTGR
jgi:chloramphenicol-sensitive protein RarD